MAREGIAVTFKYSGGTDTKQGVIFGKDGFSFNGSKIDRAFSFLKLDAALNVNAQRQDSRTTPTITPVFASSPQPEHSHHSEQSHSHHHDDSHFGGGIFGMLDMEPGAGEDDNTPTLKKKKKKQQQYKPSF